MNSPIQLSFNSSQNFNVNDKEKLFSYLKNIPSHQLNQFHPASQLNSLQVTTIIKGYYTHDYLGFYFHVLEPMTSARHNEDGSPVYKDSCVEIFIDIGESNYLNVEVNCIGSCLAAVGKNRINRTPLTKIQYKSIQRVGNLEHSCFNPKPLNKPWEMLVMVPKKLILPSEDWGKSLRGNIYKTGDDLPNPHWISYFPIPTKNPDFHRPEYFGEFLLN